MVSIQVIGSSSKGNCYLLNDGSSRLMLECGLPWRKIKEAIKFDLANIFSVLVTHEHGDHAKAVKDAAKAASYLEMRDGNSKAAVELYRLEKRLRSKSGVKVTKISSDGKRERKVTLRISELYGVNHFHMEGKKNNPRLGLKHIATVSIFEFCREWQLTA